MCKFFKVKRACSGVGTTMVVAVFKNMRVFSRVARNNIYFLFIYPRQLPKQKHEYGVPKNFVQRLSFGCTIQIGRSDTIAVRQHYQAGHVGLGSEVIYKLGIYFLSGVCMYTIRIILARRVYSWGFRIVTSFEGQMSMIGVGVYYERRK